MEGRGVSRHARVHSRPGANDGEERRDARAGQGRANHGRLRYAVRRCDGAMDHRHVCRGGLYESQHKVRDMMIRVDVRKMSCALALGLVLAALPAAAQDDGDAQAGRGGRGGRGGAPAVARTAKQLAPVDFTGYWTAVITQDWRWRMVVPPKGAFNGVPLNAEGRRVLGTWDPEKDTVAGDQYRAL